MKIEESVLRMEQFQLISNSLLLLGRMLMCLLEIMHQLNCSILFKPGMIIVGLKQVKIPVSALHHSSMIMIKVKWPSNVFALVKQMLQSITLIKVQLLLSLEISLPDSYKKTSIKSLTLI